MTHLQNEHKLWSTFQGQTWNNHAFMFFMLLTFNSYPGSNYLTHDKACCYLVPPNLVNSESRLKRAVIQLDKMAGRIISSMFDPSWLLIYRCNYRKKIHCIFVVITNHRTAQNPSFSSIYIPTATCQFHRKHYTAKTDCWYDQWNTAMKVLHKAHFKRDEHRFFITMLATTTIYFIACTRHSSIFFLLIRPRRLFKITYYSKP